MTLGDGVQQKGSSKIVLGQIAAKLYGIHFYMICFHTVSAALMQLCVHVSVRPIKTAACSSYWAEKTKPTTTTSLSSEEDPEVWPAQR